MTNSEMYEKYKLAGYPVEDGMTQVEMRAIKKSFLEEPKESFGLVIMVKNGKEFKVQSKDVAACIKQGLEEK